MIQRSESWVGGGDVEKAGLCVSPFILVRMTRGPHPYHVARPTENCGFRGSVFPFVALGVGFVGKSSKSRHPASQVYLPRAKYCDSMIFCVLHCIQVTRIIHICNIVQEMESRSPTLQIEPIRAYSSKYVCDFVPATSKPTVLKVTCKQNRR
jgi:hypothetical protein